MIPKIIHYCWFGGSELPDLEKSCIDSWHKFMPDFKFILWSEENFDVSSVPYVKEAYQEKKYAFVSDYVRLWALNKFGGVYLDVDVMVYMSLENLMEINTAFGGFEGSKSNPLMTSVIATVPNGKWVRQMLDAYQGRHFVKHDGSVDLTTNVRFITDIMIENGFVPNGKEQDYLDLHVYPVEYFSPRQTTGEYIMTENTYCDHIGISSWNSRKKYAWVSVIVGKKNMTRLIKLKRFLLG